MDELIGILAAGNAFGNQQLHRGADRGERCAQLVADHRHELRLQPLECARGCDVGADGDHKRRFALAVAQRCDRPLDHARRTRVIDPHPVYRRRRVERCIARDAVVHAHPVFIAQERQRPERLAQHLLGRQASQLLAGPVEAHQVRILVQDRHQHRRHVEDGRDEIPLRAQFRSRVDAVGDVAGNALEALGHAARHDDAHVLADPNLAAILAPHRKLQVRRLWRPGRLLVERHGARHPVGPHQLKVLHRQ